MRKSICLLIILILMPITYALVETVRVDKGTYLELIVENISPEPVEVGEDLVVKFRLSNLGSEGAKEVEISFDESHPFLLKDRAEKIIRLKELCAGCSFTITYHLSISPNAITGLYPLKVTLYEKNSSKEIERRIQVVGKPELVINESYANELVLIPGSKFLLTVPVSNVGRGGANDIRITLQLEGVPIIPLGDNVFYIKKLAPGESYVANFSLVVDKNAKVQAYKLPIQISGSYEFGATNFSSTEIVGLNIFGSATLSVASISTDPAIVKENKNFFLIIRIENTGSGDADSIKLNINLPFNGIKEIFLSKIKADSESSAIFNIKARNDGNYKYDLNIDYVDDTGRYNISYPLTLYVSPELTLFEIVIISIIVLAALLVVIWAEFRKKIIDYVEQIRNKE